MAYPAVPARLAVAIAALLTGAVIGPAAGQAAGLRLADRIEVGAKLDNFDISYVDEAAGRLYFADRSNKSVDIIDTASNKFLGRIGGFVGAEGRKGGDVGPNGVLVLPEAHQLWAGDGDSTVKIFDLTATPPALVAAISTGGKHRVDELAVDPADGVVLAANNADEPAFLSLISVKDRTVLAKVELKQASDGIEQPAFVPETGLFYFSVPQLDEHKTKGAVGVFDPKTRQITRLIPVDDCNPTGLWHGPGKKLIVGCAAGSKASGMAPATVILDVGTESLTRISQVGGEDEVYYSAGLNQYYTASRDMPGGGVLGVIDAATDRWVENLPTSANAHSVAADGTVRKVFVPLMPGQTCPNGCVGVFAPQ